MRGLGLIGIVVALALVALVARKQLAPAPSSGATAASSPDRARQAEEAYRQALDAAMRAPQRKSDDE